VCGSETNHRAKDAPEWQCVPCGIARSVAVAQELRQREGARYEAAVANGRRGGRPRRNQGGSTPAERVSDDS